MLAWINPNIIASSPKIALDLLIQKAPCQGARQEQWSDFLPRFPGAETWLWLNGDMHGGGKLAYPLNANTDVMMVKRSHDSKEFLDKVWALGDDVKLMDKYGYANRNKVKGWPFENAAIWELVTKNTERIMRNTCIAPAGFLESKWDATDAEFGRMVTDDMPADWRK